MEERHVTIRLNTDTGEDFISETKTHHCFSLAMKHKQIVRELATKQVTKGQPEGLG